MRAHTFASHRELGYDNFEPVIGSSSFTFVLSYDRMDVETSDRRSRVLSKLAESFASMKQPSSVLFRNLKLAFAKIDIRRHSYINDIYKPNDANEAWNVFYGEELDSDTFMRQKDVYLSSNWSLYFGENYNIVEFVDEESEDPTDLNAHVKELRSWLLTEVKNSIHYAMEGVGKPGLAFSESKDGPDPSMRSKITREKERRKRALKKDNTFNFSNYFALEEEKKSNATDHNQTQDFLSYHVKQDEESGDKFYKYKMTDAVEDLYSHALMESFNGVLQQYLTWAEGYEVLWDEERKRKEDEQTNYGYYLGIMNEQVKELLFSVFEDIGEDSFLSVDDVPDLEQFYTEIIFGFGRSPTDLSRYLEKEVFPKVDGPNGARGLDSTQMRRIALFECIRDLMSAKEACGEESDMYEPYFKVMLVKLHAILSEFQENLTRYYLSYRETNSLSDGEPFKFRSLEVLSMEDPANFDVLSSYDEFERRYTAKGIPVVLSNVNMTDETYTVEYLVEKCGFMPVTQSIQVSHQVGDSRVDSWGGLTEFELPRSLITQSRLDEELEDGYDKSISFEQFVILSKEIKNLYLHDYTLKGSCDQLFYDKTPYDAEQHFRLPSVVGQYDLFQKLAMSGYQTSWPSLFVGLKGSNSKVHVDSGATGFFMYLVSGRKRWVVFEHSARPFLYERLDDSSFIADVLALNLNNETNYRMDESYPLLRRGMEGGYEFIQEAGQLVYIPPNSPHAVENLDDIVGLSMNFVPRAGVASRLHDLMTDSKQEFDDVEIMLRYLMFEGGRDTLAETKDPLYTTLGEYEAQL